MPDNDFRTNSQDVARPLTGKMAIVTGASRGIGRATALALGRQGAKVCIMARGKESLDAVKNELEGAQCQCFAQVADVSDPALLEEFIANCTREFDAPAILINNAGVYATEPLLDHSLKNWNTIINTNLTSAMWASRCVLPAMIQRGWGRIINVSSISGKQGEPLWFRIFSGKSRNDWHDAISRARSGAARHHGQRSLSWMGGDENGNRPAHR